MRILVLLLTLRLSHCLYLPHRRKAYGNRNKQALLPSYVKPVKGFSGLIAEKLNSETQQFEDSNTFIYLQNDLETSENEHEKETNSDVISVENSAQTKDTSGKKRRKNRGLGRKKRRMERKKNRQKSNRGRNFSDEQSQRKSLKRATRGYYYAARSNSKTILLRKVSDGKEGRHYLVLRDGKRQLVHESEIKKKHTYIHGLEWGK